MTYGFGERLTAEFPSQIVVDLTEVCNLECRHCPHPSFKASSHYGGRHLDPGLNARLVDEVRDAGKGFTKYIRYTAEGEPLAHPSGYALIGDAVRRSGVFVTLTTNGTIMNERRTKDLLNSGLHLVDISIDALTEPTYRQIRVRGNLEVTRGNVLRLLEWNRAAGSPTKVVVSYVEQPENADETDGFVAFWQSQGVDRVVVRRLHSAAGAVVTIAQLLKKAAGQERYPCLYPWERITLGPAGHLLFCPQDWVHGSVIGDYRDLTIKDAWHGELYQRLRSAHLTGDFSGHSFCGNCPDWSATRWPGQGQSYADMVLEFANPAS